MRIMTIGLLFLLIGCTKLMPPESFAYTELKTDKFTLASWQKITSTGSPYKIFIEGDGYAFDKWGQPTANPTPKSTLVRELAFNDPAGNVIYLARPCQFVQDEACREFYWTHGRFSREVIDSSAQAIKSIVGNGEVVLIGYSGGAQVAGLVAVLHPDIKVQKLITIAGNLDHPAWVKHHSLQPLTGLLSLTDYRDAYLKIPQTHYVGKKDEVVPASITQDFIGTSAPVIVIPEAGHDVKWKVLYL